MSATVIATNSLWPDKAIAPDIDTAWTTTFLVYLNLIRTLNPTLIMDEPNKLNFHRNHIGSEDQQLINLHKLSPNTR